MPRRACRTDERQGGAAGRPLSFIGDYSMDVQTTLSTTADAVRRNHIATALVAQVVGNRPDTQSRSLELATGLGRILAGAATPTRSSTISSRW